MITLQQFVVLKLIAQYGTITSVAEHMNLRQPTVTFHMKKLEEHAAVRLFEHKHKRVFLTETGQALLAHATRIVKLTEEVEQMLDDYRTYRRGKIIIGASNTPATYILPTWLHEIRTIFPKIQIGLQVRNAPAIIDMVSRFEIDFGLIGEQTLHISNSVLNAYPLMNDELGLTFHPNHPFSMIDPIPTDLLEKQQWILREKDSSSRRMFEQWAMHKGIAWEPNMELDSTETIKRAVISRLGVALLSHMAVREEIQEGKLLFRSIDSRLLYRKIFFVYHRNRFMTPLIENVIQFFLDKAEP